MSKYMSGYLKQRNLRKQRILRHTKKPYAENIWSVLSLETFCTGQAQDKVKPVRSERYTKLYRYWKRTQ